jgi:hypothetical protein
MIVNGKTNATVAEGRGLFVEVNLEELLIENRNPRNPS